MATDDFESLSDGDPLSDDPDWDVHIASGTGVPTMDQHDDHSDGSQVVDMSDVGDSYNTHGDPVGSDDHFVECQVFIDVEDFVENVAGPIGRGSGSFGSGTFDGYAAFAYGLGVGGGTQTFQVGIFRIDNNTPTELVNTGNLQATYPAGSLHTVRLEVDGSTLTAYVDGNQELQTTDGTYSTGQGHAFRLFREVASAPSQPFVDNFDGDALAGGVTVTVADSQHAHTSDTATVDVAYQTSPADSQHGHTSDTVAVSTAAEVTVSDSQHGQTSEQASVAVTYATSPADSQHGHTSDTATVDVAYQVAPSDSQHQHTSETAAVAVSYTVTPAGSQHGHTSETVGITAEGVVAVADSTHAHTSEPATVQVAYTTDPADSQHPHTSGLVGVSVSYTVTPVDSQHLHTSDTVTTAVSYTVAPLDSTHVHTSQLVDVSDPAIPNGVAPVSGSVRVLDQGTTVTVLDGPTTVRVLD